jgi:predicted ester cyclase
MISPHPNGDAVRALLKAAYERDFEQAAAFASPDIEVVDEPTGQRFVGHEGLRQFVQYWLDTFHDFQYDITNLVADDVGVAIEYVYQAWHVAPSSSSVRELASGTHAIQSRSAAFFQMADGKVIGYHLYYNPPQQFP